MATMTDETQEKIPISSDNYGYYELIKSNKLNENNFNDICEIDCNMHGREVSFSFILI